MTRVFFCKSFCHGKLKKCFYLHIKLFEDVNSSNFKLKTYVDKIEALYNLRLILFRKQVTYCLDMLVISANLRRINNLSLKVKVCINNYFYVV